MEVSDQLHAPAALPPGKNPRYPLDRRLGGTQSRSGRGGKVGWLVGYMPRTQWITTILKQNTIESFPTVTSFQLTLSM